MNRGQIVRADASEHGIRLRLWIDDETGHHLAVAETLISDVAIAAYAREVVAEQQRGAQYALGFDD